MNEELAQLLNKRGYKLGGKSDSGKKVDAFEKEEVSRMLFNVIKSEQIFRVLGSFLFKEAVSSVDKLVMNIKGTELKNTMPESIVKKAVCKHCKSEILFPKFDSIPNNVCQTCSKKCYEIEDDWDLKLDMYGILVHYLNRLKDEGILSKYLEVYCPACLTNAEYFEEPKFKRTDILKALSCEKCGGLKEIRWVYTSPESIFKFWENSGAWLEWYVKNLLLTKGIEAIQGVKVRDNKNKEVEVDCLMTKAKKIISISCKVASFNNAYNKDPEIDKLLPFSDYVILVSTTKISDSLKSRFQRMRPKCKKIFIDGNEIEKLPEIISQI